MAWYDVFSAFYDASLEPHYRVQRQHALAALDVRPGMTVLDLPCGTGQSMAALSSAVGPQGTVWGVDLSAGMLRQARARADRQGFANVKLLQADARTLTAGALGTVPVDRLHVFLGMSVFPDPQGTLHNLWGLLAPGGRCVLVDVHAASLGLQGRLVNWMAQADIRRRFWEPLEALAPGRVERVELPSKPLHGGKIFMASASKPS